MMFSEGPTLVVAAHPDDEVLGAGGWMARFPGAKVAIISEGTSAEALAVPDTYVSRFAAKRAASERAAALLGSEIVWQGTRRDQRLHDIPLTTVIADVVDVLRKVSPAIVLTHHPADLNQDHRAVTEAVLVATRPFTTSGLYVRAVLGFTVDVVTAPGRSLKAGGEFMLGLTEDQLALKLRACAEYHHEMRDWPHPRSLRALEALARISGARIGREAAEPYTLLWGCH